MAIYGQSLTIQYVAWDTVNNAPKTGDVANHTLRWVKDGTAAAPTNSPSEVDATNAPGVYKLTLTASETQCWVGTLCGKSSTSGVVIMPITLAFERLPTTAPGSNGGLPVIGQAPLTNLDAAVSSRSTLTAADVWSYGSRTLSGFSFQVTVGGYASGQSPSEQVQGLGYTSARAGKLDNLDASVSSRLAASSYVVPDNASITAIKAKTDKLTFNEDNYVYAVGVGGSGGTDWTDDEKKQIRYRLGIDGTTQTPSTNTPHLGSTYSTLDDLASHVSTRLATSDYVAPDNTTISSIYSIVAAKLDATISSRLASASYVAPDNTGIAAIKSQTNKLQFDSNNYVYAVGIGGGGGIDWTDVEKQQIRYRLGIDGTTAQPASNLPHLDIAASVVVQPLQVQPIARTAGGGLIEAFQYARIRASWLVSRTNLENHDLRFLVYKPSDPSEAVIECNTSEISVELQGEDSIVTLDAAERAIEKGLYAWVLRDQTVDVVLLYGKFLMKPAPDAG